jgi:hypothetical protein
VGCEGVSMDGRMGYGCGGGLWSIGVGGGVRMDEG